MLSIVVIQTVTRKRKVVLSQPISSISEVLITSVGSYLQISIYPYSADVATCYMPVLQDLPNQESKQYIQQYSATCS